MRDKRDGKTYDDGGTARVIMGKDWYLQGCCSCSRRGDRESTSNRGMRSDDKEGKERLTTMAERRDPKGLTMVISG